MSRASHHTNLGKCLLAAVLLALMAGAPQALAAEDITGEWEVTTDMGGQPMYSTLTLTKNPDGTLAGKWGSEPLSSVKLDGQKLTFTRTLSFGGNEMQMNFAGTLADGKITGTMGSDQFESQITAVKKKPLSPAVGMWNLKYDVGGQDMTAKLTISQKPDGTLDGKWESQMGQSVVSNVKFADGKLTLDRAMKMDDQEMKMTFAGTIQGDKLTGTSKSEMGDIAITGTRLGSEIIGKWNLTTITERGTRTITMTIFPDLSGRYESFAGSETPMKNVKFENGQLTFAVESFGGQQDFKGKVEGKTIKGQMTSERGTTEISGTKAEAGAPAGTPAVAARGASAPAAGIVGTWEFTRQGRDGTPQVNTLKINPDMTGTFTMRDTPSPIKDLKVTGNQVTFKVTMSFGGNEMTQDFKGTMEGQTLKGAFISERGEREATGKKVQ